MVYTGPGRHIADNQRGIIIMGTHNWETTELNRMIYFGIRWEVVITVNPELKTAANYSYYQANKYSLNPLKSCYGY